MVYFVYGIFCDATGCTALLERQNVKLRALEAIAREEGWAVGSHGHFCKEHRSRATRRGK